MLTLAYITTRTNPRIEWFFESLLRQWNGIADKISIVVVDYHHARRDQEFLDRAEPFIARGVRVIHVPPKPTVWQGPHRLTTQDYFAASNARNTALCLAPDGYIAYVDDLSVLLPGWLTAVLWGKASNSIVCGSYAKVLNLVVENGAVKSFKGSSGELGDLSYEDVIRMSAFPAGIDTRFKHAPNERHRVKSDDWVFGCSLGLPVETLLSLNGWDEDCDSMGSEDSILGVMLHKAGHPVYYCKTMMTLESEEAHYEDKPLKRIIKGPPGPTDASWRILNMARSGGRKTAPNYFGPMGIRGLRQRVLAGEPFPFAAIPEHHWPDGQPLNSM